MAQCGRTYPVPRCKILQNRTASGTNGGGRQFTCDTSGKFLLALKPQWHECSIKAFFKFLLRNLVFKNRLSLGNEVTRVMPVTDKVWERESHAFMPVFTRRFSFVGARSNT